MGTENKKVNVYLLTNNYRFKQYLDFDEKKFSVKTHFVKKERLGANFHSGIIFLFNQERKIPNWGSEVSALAKSKLRFNKTNEYKALVFLRLYSNEQRKNFTFALTFGGAHHHLNTQFIAQDFGIKTSKSLVSPENVASVDSIAIDRKIYNIRKQSSTLILPEKIHSRGEHTIVRKIHGKGNLDKLSLSETGKVNIQVGGAAALNLTGKISINSDFVMMLSKMADLYIHEKPENQLFQVHDPIQPIRDKEVSYELDYFLGRKIMNILSASSFDKRSLKWLAIQPQEIFELDSFNGFFVTGIGYKEPKSVESYGEFTIDEVNYFEKLRILYASKGLPEKVEQIILKLQQDQIKARYFDRQESEKICSVYQALSLEILFKGEKYILVAGKWYRVDKEYYQELKTFIDSLKKDSLSYIPLDVKKHIDTKGKTQEGLYNDDLIEHLKALKLDVTKFKPDVAIMRKLEFKLKSNIELCDVLLFTPDEIHFIHVKRHSGASGISHLLAQANASAQIYLEDRENVATFIQREIQRHNENTSSSYCVLPFHVKDQKRFISLAIIDKSAFDSSRKAKKNSSVLSLLEMISVRENIQILENMGYTCYLKFVDSNE